MQNISSPDIFRLLVEQSRDYALFVLDPNGIIATWNAGAQLIKGYRADEIIGRHFSLFYEIEAVARGWPKYELEMAAAQGHFEDEGWRVRKDGTRFWASVVITAVLDAEGTLVGFSKITRDLTVRKQQEEVLRQSEERFRLMIDGVLDYAIYTLDCEGIVTSWNSGAERIKGYSRDEIIGQHFSRFYKPSDIEMGKPMHELSVARRDGRAEDEGWRLRKNGEPFWARVVVTALHDEDGELRGFAKVTQDLSAKRHLQELERASRNVSEFISTLSHELRNPLAPIRSAVMVMGKLQPDDPRHQAMREMIDRQSAQLARIVDDLIDVSRITRGVVEIARQPVNIAEVVKQSVETALPHVEARGHELKVVLPDHPLWVVGDLHRLVQVLTNLLNNAARYSDQGSSIQVQVIGEPLYVAIHVRDSGHGIAADQLERIFQMFVQGTSSQSGSSGLGIGLALSRKLAELHGGTLHAFSEGLGKGSEFVLRVPSLLEEGKQQ